MFNYEKEMISEIYLLKSCFNVIINSLPVYLVPFKSLVLLIFYVAVV